MPSLIIQRADGTTERRAVGAGTYTIGRDVVCEFVLDDLKASRMHARIHPESDGGHTIEDLGSKNGTLVNGQRLARHRLRDGDRVEIGTTVLIFCGDEPVSTDTRIIVDDRVRPMSSTSVARRDEKLQLPQKRLEMLMELSDRLVKLQSRSELLTTVMDICFETLRFERGLIAMKNRPGEPPEWPVVRNLAADRATGELTISRSILRRAMEDGERTIINDAQSADFDPTVSIAAHRIRSAMCVPMQFESEILGVIYGDRTTSTTVYTREDIDFLAALARQASIGIANNRLLEQSRRIAALEHELSVARRIQTGLFPTMLPSTPQLEVRAHNEPGRQVSGDYYDVVPMNDGRTAVIVADVSGKGVSAALLMANLQAAVRVTLPTARDPAAVVRQWNRLLYDNTDAAQFVTMLLAIVSPEAPRIEIVNAGHMMPICIWPDGTLFEPPESGSLPLGVEREEPYYVQHVERVGAPNTLLLYTDGVTEAVDEQHQFFGAERLREAVRGTGAPPAGELIDATRLRLRKFCGKAPLADDVTLVAVQMR